MELFNASGAARRLRASPLFAIGPSEPGPALRRGALVAIPVGLALLLELGLDSPTKGAIGTGALLAGFPGLDAPARTRAAWQAATAPLIGIAAALGVLTGSSAVLAVLTMAVVGAAAGYCFAVSLRLSIAGLSVALSLLITQGLPLDLADTLPALALRHCRRAASGRLVALRLGFGRPRGGGRGERLEQRMPWPPLFAPTWTLRSVSFRHALRFGAALAAGVAAYWLLGMSEHGFWIPLTILFVLRPEQDETFRRLILRAVGTLVGLVVATALAEWLRRRRPRDWLGLDDRHRLRLRPADGPVRALHRRDHHLRRAARRLDRRDGAARRRPAGPRHGDRDRDRRRRLPDLGQPDEGGRTGARLIRPRSTRRCGRRSPASRRCPVTEWSF